MVDVSSFPEVANWATTMLAAYWTTPPGTVTLGVASSAVYDVVKRFIKKPAAAGALEEARTTPRDAAALQALALQIAERLKEDAAFRVALLELVPPEVVNRRTTMHQSVTGDRNKTVQNSGDNTHIHVS